MARIPQLAMASQSQVLIPNQAQMWGRREWIRHVRT